MKSPSSRAQRERLVQHLRRRGFLTEDRVAAAFLDVPREVFLRDYATARGLDAVYQDDAIVVRRDADGMPCSSSSQPAIMALMLQMLAPEPGHRVLEIGAGTGYNAALLQRLVGPEGLVVTADVAEIAARGAAEALRTSVDPSSPSSPSSPASPVPVVVADGRGRVLRPGSVDRVEVTASSDRVPPAWHEQLVPDGLLVVPLRLSDEPDSTHAVVALQRTATGFDSVAVTAGGFMPLRSPETSDSVSRHPRPSASGGADGPSGGQPVTGIGPPVSVGREHVHELQIAVRYTDEPPECRWLLPRGDHWIGASLAGEG